MDNWYLAYCKARQEDTAATGLREQGYVVYLPKLRRRRRRAGGTREVDEPLFPRYLFVAPAGEEQPISPAQYTAGVQKLIRFGVEFLSVPNAIVVGLQAREDPNIGCHRLTLPPIKRGDPVRIGAGPLAGIEGIFEAQSGHDRVVVLLELLGQKTRTEVPIDELDI